MWLWCVVCRLPAEAFLRMFDHLHEPPGEASSLNRLLSSAFDTLAVPGR